VNIIGDAYLTKLANTQPRRTIENWRGLQRELGQPTQTVQIPKPPTVAQPPATPTLLQDMWRRYSGDPFRGSWWNASK